MFDSKGIHRLQDVMMENQRYKIKLIEGIWQSFPVDNAEIQNKIIVITLDELYFLNTFSAKLVEIMLPESILCHLPGCKYVSQQTHGCV